MTPRVLIWLFHLALPLAGLWLLIARPELDLMWQDRLVHFVVVLGTALVSVGLAIAVGRAARARGDARLTLVGLAFLSAAGFLALHAFATPTVLVDRSNPAFSLSTIVGVTLAGAFAAWSSSEPDPDQAAAIARAQGPLTVVLLVVIAAWAVATAVPGSVLTQPIPEEGAQPAIAALAAVGLGFYGFATVRYVGLYRRRSSVVLLSIVTAFVLLAESLVALAVAPTWHASWWEWHVLMAFAFGYVAYSARVQYEREGRLTSLFRAISLEETVRRLRDEYGAALEQLVAALEEAGRSGGRGTIAPLTARLASSFGLTEGQVDVLERAAESVAAERDEVRRLDAVVHVGQEARVILPEEELLARALEHLRAAFRDETLAIRLVRDGRLEGGPGDEQAASAALGGSDPVEKAIPGGARLLLPLAVKGRPSGLLVVEREGGPFGERTRALLATVATQLSIALENARLYREIDRLFRSYLSPEVATALLADPDQARLGGGIVEISVLFADLRGFTPFSERSAPDEVVALLNRYFGVVVPIVIAEGGTVVQFVGDAIMAIWNAPVRQADHAIRACRTGLAMQRTIDELIAAEGPAAAEWPRFRVGINTGPALVGNVGAEVRSFTAIGDTINLAARLQSAAEVGQVVIGPGTYGLVEGVARVRPLGGLDLKGKADRVEAWELVGLGAAETSVVEQTP